MILYCVFTLLKSGKKVKINVVLLNRKEEMDVKQEYLTIDSRNRDKTNFQNPNHYIYEFDDVLKNVESVELVYAIYDKVGTDFYVNLHISELGTNAISNNPAIRESFTQLPLLTYLNEYSSDKFRSMKLFPKPIPKLQRLTFRFTRFDGTLYPMMEHMLIFQISYYLYSGSIEFNAFGNKNIEDNSLTVLNLSSNYSKEELNESYVMKKKSLLDANGSAHDYQAIKNAYTDLNSRIRQERLTDSRFQFAR